LVAPPEVDAARAAGGQLVFRVDPVVLELLLRAKIAPWSRFGSSGRVRHLSVDDEPRLIRPHEIPRVHGLAVEKLDRRPELVGRACIGFRPLRRGHATEIGGYIGRAWRGGR